ncbi:MAG: ComEC/Rec2 family competence protein [Patescibacteria group bacterium]|mgnify:CR=1 FL=1
MPSYDIFFFGALFFLVGILFASIGLNFWTLVIVFVFLVACLALGYSTKQKKFFLFSCLVFFTVLGSLFYTWDDQRFTKETNLVFDEKISFSGIVVSNPKISSGVQEFSVDLKNPFSGKILFKTNVYPEYKYGDELKFEGIVKSTEQLSEGYAKYLEKEGVVGLVSFPKTEILGSGGGPPIKSFLFGIRNKIAESFAKVLSSHEAAFLGGLTLGGTEGLPQSFKEAMRSSGTTHLVALSGYNISIIITAIMGTLAYFLSRRLSFILATIVIVGFVLMTGAEASVVRAAIMGFLVLLAGEVGRLFDFRNAIIFAGLLMVLENPKVLVFDIGFQLSFLALLGIIYLKPSIEKFFKIDPKDKSGFLNWRENLLTTASAQFMVLPLLIANFDQFSLTSFIANVLILGLIPVTMALGFLIAGLSLVSYSLSLILSWIVSPLLKIEIGFIELFAKLAIPLKVQFGLVLSLIYYGLIIAFIVYVQRFNSVRRKTQK